MKGVLKRIAFVLAFVMATECMSGGTLTMAGELFESVVDSVDNLQKNDEVLSGSSVVNDDESVVENEGIEEISETTTEEVTINISQLEDDEINTDDIPDGILVLLNDGQMYENLNGYEKNGLNMYLGVREDTMSQLHDRGYDIRHSISIAVIMQQMEINVDQAFEMIRNFGSLKKAKKSAEEFAVANLDSNYIEQESVKEKFQEMLISGVDMESAVKAFFASAVIEKKVDDVVDAVTSQSAVEVVPGNDLFVPVNSRELADKYAVDEDAVNQYIEKNDTNAVSLAKEIDELAADRGLLSTYSTTSSSTTTEDDIDNLVDSAKLKGPFNTDSGINDNVSLSTGALMYTENIATIPGKNGIDTNLSLKFDSSNRFEEASSVSVWDIPSEYVWHLGFSRIANTAGGNKPHGNNNVVIFSQIILEDGRTYSIGRVNMTGSHAYKIYGYAFQDLRLQEDYQNTVQGAKAVLTYGDGTREFFNKQGLLIKKVDRFENAISVSYNHDDITITNVNGSQITMIASTNATGTVKSYTVTLPNGHQIIYTFNRCNYYDDRVFYYLDKKTENVNGKDLVTSYYYTAKSDTIHKAKKDVRKFYSYNLSKVVYPTGATANYDYGEGIYGNENSDDKYRRISCKYYTTPDGKKYLGTSYFYSENNYTGHKKKNESRAYPYTVRTVENNLDTTYTYDSHNLNTKIVSGAYPKDVRKTVEMGYYNVENDGEHICPYPNWVYTNDDNVIKAEYYYYDNYSGKLLRYYSPLSCKGREYEYLKEKDLDKEGLTEYTYYGDSNYYVQKSKTYKQNSSTTIVERNTIDSNSLITESTVTANSDLKAKTQYSYNSKGDVIEQRAFTDGTHYIPTTYTYDDITHYVNSSTTGKITVRKNYDNMGNVTSETDGNGYTTSYTYDDMGNVVKTTNPDNTYKTVSYDYVANTAQYTDENGNAIRYNYNALGALSSIYDLSYNKYLATYEYDEGMNLSEKIVPDKNKTDYTYDYKNRISSKTIKDALTGVQMYGETYSYSNGQTKKTVLGDDNCSNIDSGKTVDNMGYVVQEIKNGVLTNYTNDYLGNHITATDYLNKSYTMEYDAFGNVTKQIDPNGHTTTYTYDSLGRNVSVTDAKGNKSDITYDANDRKIQVETPFGNLQNAITKYTYDNNNNVLSESVRKQGEEYNTKIYEYDKRNNLKQSGVQLGNKIEQSEKRWTNVYTYDKVGNNTSVTYADGTRTVKYTYNSHNKPVTYTDAMGKTERYTYDFCDNLISKVDRNNVTIKYAYDGMNRLSKEYTTTNNKEKVKAQYTYGKTGGVTLVTNDTSAIANKYDNKGLVMEQKLFEDGKSYAMVYGNNANGKCVYSKIYNNNTGHYGDYDIQQMINYEYDAKGNMTTVSDSLNNSKVMARYTYDSNDNLSSVTYGNGTSTSYTYNKGNMIEKVINNNADNTQMSIYSYDYYLDGNVSQQNRNGVKCYYDYDEFSRIIDEDYGREEIDYYYDAAGNRTLKKICDDNGDTDVNYTYDLNNRLLEESTNYYSKNKTDVTKYVYDNNGNQIKKIGYITKGVNGSPSQDLVSENELNNTYEIYKYNEFNEMTSFESNKESKWEYAYLPNGLRYRKSNASHFDRYVWDRNGNIIAEMNGEGNLTNKYVRGNKLISKNGNEYFGYDGHGSVVNISNESGKSIKSYDYDAFGVELNKDANDTNLFRYCAEQYDNETDSIYLRARYYSPSLGRFTTEDPAKDGNNWYSYCAGNPVNSWDPSGLAIIISDIEDENDSRLSDLRKLTSDNLKVNYDTGEISYIEGEKIDLPIGTDLIRELINSDVSITIRKFDRVADKDDSGNGRITTEYRNQGKCSSVLIHYDPNGGRQVLSYDPVTVTSDFVDNPPEIVLGHELVHAIRAIKDEYVLYGNAGYAARIDNINSIVRLAREREELETTGIPYAKFDENGKFDRIVYSQNEFKYTENALRVESGLPVRSVYK